MGRDNQSLDLDDDELWTFTDWESVPSSDRLYRALTDQDRRRALYCLLEYEEQSIDEMTDILAGWELFQNGVVGNEAWEQTRTQLVHVHLPMLEDCGLIEYDADSGDAQIKTLPDPVRDLIRFTQKYDRSLMAHDLR